MTKLFFSDVIVNFRILRTATTLTQSTLVLSASLRGSDDEIIDRFK